MIQEERVGWRPVLTQEEVFQLPLLRVEVAVRPYFGEGIFRRRVYRAAERLWEEGINRVLVPREFPHCLWKPLQHAGLQPVEALRAD